MGCFHSHGRLVNMAGQAADFPQAIVGVITPDPDLGWRRHVGGDGFSTTADGKGGAEDFLYPSSGSWSVRLVNDRSGSYCTVSVAVMSLNIGIRASHLAEAFGVVSFAGERGKGIRIDDVAAGAGGESAGNLMRENSPADEVVAPRSDDDGRQIYRELRVPDSQWRLQERRNPSAPRRRSPTHSANSVPHPVGAARTEVSSRPIGPDCYMQKLQKRSETAVYGDVAEVGMNVAEQLLRLERGKDKRHSFPTSLFGWRLGPPEQCDGFKISATSPEGDSFWFVPEELIMNVASWVQQTYLTTATF